MINLNGMKASDFSFHFMGDGMMLLSGLAFAMVLYLVRMFHKNRINDGNRISTRLWWISTDFTRCIYRWNSKIGILLLTYMALLSATAFTIWTVLSKYNKISKIAIYNFLTPVFGALLSALFLGENLFTWNNILALFLVSTGICIVNVIKKPSLT